MGASLLESANEMSTSASSQANSADGGMAKTIGGEQGTLHGQLTQQPFG